MKRKEKMMKKKLLSLLIAGIMALTVLSGCATSNENEPDVVVDEAETKTPEPVAEPSPTPEGFPVILERTVVDGQMQSYLTGEWKDQEVVTRRPIAVMIPNNSPAMPQYGISKASIIYEAPVEGRITRLMAVFEDFDDLDRIGPVRSSRDYFIYVAMGYEAIYCNWGLARPYV